MDSIIRFAYYKQRGNKIDMDEWIGYARSNVVTSLGKKLLGFVMEKIVCDCEQE
ncbi:MAG: hypothetical protein NC313_04710 [Butyrivibrio sp.]|nr:hypothetical protein [Butyrivibrio sp.]